MAEEHFLTLEEVNHFCDQFEDLWKEAPPLPNISDFLGRVPGPPHEDLIRFLLAIDVEYRMKGEIPLDLGQYAELSPNAESMAKSIVAKYSERSEAAAVKNPSEPRAEKGEAKTNAEADPNPGQSKLIAGRYKLLQQIGDGGMGSVWMAEQLEPIRRRVALKLIKTGMDSKQIIARFEAERQALALMDHENISKVFEAGTTEDGRPFFVMELVKGIPLTDYCDQNKLNIHQRLELFIPVCRAVQHAHQKGIIHRDLKPNNVLVTQYDGHPIPKVIDFGLAKALGDDSRLTEKTMFTEFGQVVGTLQYMSPEQAELNAIDVDTRTDIYSLGVMLYELLAGSTPIEKNEITKKAFLQVLKTIRDQDPPAPSTRLSESGEAIQGVSLVRRTDPKRLQQILRGELDWIVMKSLEKDRVRRYPTAVAFADDITCFLNHDVVSARPPSTFYTMSKFVRRHRGKVAALTTIFSLLIVGIVSTAVSLRWVMIERQVAVKNASKAAEQRAVAEEAAEFAWVESRRAEEEGTNARRANLMAEQYSVQLRESLARSAFLLANARWNEQRAGEASEILHSIPNQKGFRSFEWYLSLRQLLGSARTLYGHTKGIATVAISRDGTLIASAGLDHSIKIWDASTGQWTKSMSGHTDSIHSIAFSPDGKGLASASADKSIRLWNRHSGELLGTLLGHSSRVSSIAFNSDGTLLVSGSDDRTVRLWNCQEQKELTTFAPLSHAVLSVALSPKGDKIFSSTHYGVYVSDLQQGSQRELHHESANLLYQAALSPSGKHLAVGKSSGEVLLLDAQTGQKIKSLTGDRGSVWAVAFSPDGTRLASTGIDQKIQLWDLESGSNVTTWVGHCRPVSSLAFFPDGYRVVSGSWDMTLKLWTIDEENEAKKVIVHPNTVSSVAFSPDGQRLATGGGNASVRIWERESHRELRALEGHRDLVRSVTYNPEGTLLASGSDDHLVKLWNAADGKNIQTLEGHKGIVYCVAFSPDGKYVASASRDRSVKIWDVERGVELKNLIGHELYVTSVTFSPNGAHLASGSADGTIKIWNSRSGEEIMTLTGHEFVVTSLAFNPKGTRIASGSEDRTCRIWDAETGNEINTLEGHTSFVTSVAFSPDGSRLASASTDRSLRIWDAHEGSELMRLNAHKESVTSVAFSPDGNLLVSGGNDHKLILWNGDSDIESRMLVGHRYRVKEASLVFNEKTIRSKDASGVVKYWETATGNELQGETQLQSEMTQTHENRWIVASSDKNVVVVDQDYKRRNPMQGSASNAGPRIQWHQEESKRAQEREDWFAVAFHSAWLLKAQPEDAEAKSSLTFAMEQIEGNEPSADLSNRSPLPAIAEEFRSSLRIEKN